MILAMLQLTTTSIAASACIWAFWLNIKRHQMAKGSHKRYVYTSLLLTTTCVEALMWFATAGLSILQRRYATAAMSSLCIIFCILRIWSYKDDDNWFNRQAKRLGKSLKRLRQRMIVIKPAASPA